MPWLDSQIGDCRSSFMFPTFGLVEMHGFLCKHHLLLLFSVLQNAVTRGAESAHNYERSLTITKILSIYYYFLHYMMMVL